ncbi:hypothetical protein ACOSQ4_016302 [Xanthoceras sorbifolium]
MESSPTINIARVSSENSSTKRCRGQPKGSGKLQNMASLGGYFAETAGGNLTPHLVTVPIGEDLAGKILSFSRNSSKALCVLSATGTVSSVVLCQSGCVANGLKFVGQFEILHLSGSFTHTEVGGKNRRIGKLSISLSKPDGQVFGGVVVGPLIAATPIQGGSIKLISALNFYKKNYIIKISLNKIINRYKIINLNKLNHDKPLPL